MIALIDKYFPDLTRPQRGQFEALYALYADWNTKINVISRKDFDQLYLRHVLHSLAIAKVCPFAPGARVLDVGCGGGFPSVPLAILFPEAHFTAADSIRKKITVVGGVAAGLGLGAYQVAWSRRLEASGAWLSTVPVWGAQLGIAAGVCAAGLLAALVLTRPPRRFERRGLD